MPQARSVSPYPLRQFVLKVHGRCDLACDHCYVYEHADQSWRRKPRMMSIGTVRAAASRIAAHAAAWRLPAVRVVLHGGEPLLLGPDRMRAVLTTLTDTIAPVTRVDLLMQSNGLRLDPAMCEVLKAHAVRVGISLDGDRSANDRHRRFANGASSFDRVRDALALLRTPRFRELYAGILCTVDVRNDPVDVYEALLAERPPQVEFLLPHATWERPPWRPAGVSTPYADWLTAIHDRWVRDGRPMRIRMFDSIRSTAAGGPSGSEQIGVDPADLAVVDTDGRWEQADSIKTAYDGAPETGMDLIRHSVDDLSRLAPIRLRQVGVAGLCGACRSCPVVTQCGGGLYAHRYRADNGFDNPSVYCADLRRLIPHVTASATTSPTCGEAPAGALPVDLVDQIADGFGDESTLRWLVGAELNITRALLVSVAEQAGRGAAWHLLTQVEARAPEAARQVLRHPYVRVWAVGQLRGSSGGRERYLGELAGAAAIAAGMEAEVDVAVAAGVIHLPTVGTVHWPSSLTDTVRLEVRSGLVTLVGPDRTLALDLAERDAPAWWQPARRVDLGGWSIVLDDGDPHRGCHGWPTADRLGERDERAWRQALVGAWRLIRAEAPGYTVGLRAGLRTVVPLQPDRDGFRRASTARNAFGSVAAALAPPEELAVMLVHEFQHGKLGALLDLCDLFDPASPARIKVGWRPDPRPVEGVLQGVYAHAAVADIWRARTERDTGGPAGRAYARYRDWTAAGIAALRASGALTPLGQRFVDRLDAAVSGWPR